MRLSLRDKIIILNLILFSKLRCIGQLCTILKYTKKGYTISSHKHLLKQNNGDFFIQLLNAWLHFTNNFLPPNVCKRNSRPTHIFKSTIQTDNLLSIASHPTIFQKNLLLIIRDLCRSLQPCVISSTTFGEKLDFTTANHIKEYINLLWT